MQNESNKAAQAAIDIAQELNNPLTFIASTLELAKELLAGPVPAEESRIREIYALIEQAHLGAIRAIRAIKSTDQESAEVTRADPIASKSVHRPRVLVLDDEPAIVHALERLLAKRFDVLAATDGQTALASIERDTFDLILCDLMMPEVSGIEVFRKSSAGRPEIAEKFVFMTGGAFLPETSEFLSSVPNPRIRKPFETDAVFHVLEEYLKRRSPPVR